MKKCYINVSYYNNKMKTLSSSPFKREHITLKKNKTSSRLL